MRRLGIQVLQVAGAVLAASVTIVAFLLIALNTTVGQDALARLADMATRGEVKITELRGRFPGSLRASRLELTDAGGVWLRLEDVALVWTPFALLRNQIQIEQLSIRHANIIRFPASNQESKGGGMPAITIDALAIDKLETGASLSRTPMELSVHGGAHFVWPANMGAKLAIMRLGSIDAYRIDAAVGDGAITGHADVEENTGGLITGLLGLNEIGPIRLHAQGSGPNTANRVEMTLHAGPLHATAGGMVDLFSKSMDLQFSGDAPAMALRPDLSWASLTIAGNARGIFPDLAMQADGRVRNPKLAGNTADDVQAHAAGTGGALSFTALVSSLKLTGLNSNPFARAPVAITGNTNFKASTPSLTVAVSPPVLDLHAKMDLGESKTINATLSTPRLEDFVPPNEVDIKGRGTLVVNAEIAPKTSHMRLNGKIDVTGGNAAFAKLLGTTNLALDMSTEGKDLTISQASMRGTGIESRLTGGMKENVLALDLSMDLLDLARLAPGLRGNVRLQAHAHGPLENAKLDVAGTGSVGTTSFAPQPMRLKIDATGFPVPWKASFGINGSFAGSPVTLGGSLSRKDRALNVLVDRGDWKSLHARADIAVSETKRSSGQATLQIADIGDLAPIIGRALQGRVDATVSFDAKDGKPNAHVDAVAVNIGDASTRIGQVKVSGDAFPLDKIGLSLSATQISAGGFTGGANARVKGSISALGIQLDADVKDTNGEPARIAGVATLNTEDQRLTFSALTANYRNQILSLQKPAVIALRDGVAVQGLNARIGNASLVVNGRLAPTLDVTAAIQNLTADVLRPFTPLTAGTLSGTAMLRGEFAAPEGSVTVQGRNLRFDKVPKSIPAAQLDLGANLHGGTASIEGSFNAGPSVSIVVAGDAPLAAGRDFRLTAKGNTDFAVLNPILSAEGQNLRGQVVIDSRVEGPRDKPRVLGTAQLSNGETQDYQRSVRVYDIAADVRFAGDKIEIVQLSGRAGDGTISGKGSINLAASGMPTSLTIEARNAQPLTSDRLRANLDADVTIDGKVAEQLKASGRITIRRGQTVLPDGLPPRVVTLDIRRHGEKLPAKSANQVRPSIALDLTVVSNGQFFLRGHGLEAELEGSLHIGGTDAAPIITGGLTMRRGTLDLAGQTLVFTTGRVSFDGAGLRNRLDPTLEFTAEATSGAVTAKLEVTGYASAPKIQLSSTPQAPQDEILARLLFQQSAKQLTPFQMAQIAQAAASLSGLASGFDPVSSLRRSLGLDRFAVSAGGGANGSASGQPTIEAGKYIAGGVYVAAKQGFGNSAQAEVQIDLTKNLKARATVNTGTTAGSAQGTATQSLASSVGLSYQFEY